MATKGKYTTKRSKLMWVADARAKGEKVRSGTQKQSRGKRYGKRK